MKRLSTILDFVLIFAVLLLACTGCGAGTRVAYTETRETLDASGAVIGKETVSVERNSKAINTKVELKDLESTLTFSPTNGLSSGLSTSDLQSSPETRAFDTVERSFALWRGMRADQGNGDQSKLSPLEEFLIVKMFDDEEPKPPITPEDRELLSQIPDLRDDLEAIRVAIQAQQGPPESADGE